MNNFVFHNPVKMIFGRGSLSQLGKEVGRWGDRALLVSGTGSIKRNNVHAQVIQSLNSENITWLEHDGVIANPLLSHVRAGIEKARSGKCSVILGVGGGSVLDTAKAIAVGMPIPHDVWKFFTGKKSVQSTLPVVCVPTVAGSGSDMNSGMVLTHDDNRFKFGFAHRYLYPKVSISDPETTLSVPARQTAYGAVDIISHCLEAYLSTSAANISLQKGFMETICRSSIHSCNRLLTHPESIDDRGTMLWSASLALSGITTTGLGKISFPMHLLEHAVSAHLDIPHGAGLAALIPGFTTYHLGLLSRRLARFGRKVFDLEGPNERVIAQSTIESLADFLRSAGCPVSLKEVGVSPKDTAHLVQHCLKQAQIWRMRDYDAGKVSTLLEYCYNP